MQRVVKADNGVMFFFVMWCGNICITLDDKPHMEIIDVKAEDFDHEVDKFMSAWNWANPKW